MDQFHRSKKIGDVNTFLDKQIGKRVFSIRGLVSMNSFIEFPNPDATDATSRAPINASGPFIYIQYRRIASSNSDSIDKSVVLLHLDISTSRGLLRLSISTLYQDVKVAGNTLRLPLRASTDGCWTVFALDTQSVLKRYVSRSISYHYLRSVKLCPNMVIRDIFTSHQAFAPTSVPAEMLLQSRPGTDLPPRFGWIWCPDVPPSNQIAALHSPPPQHRHRPPTSQIGSQLPSEGRLPPKLELSHVLGMCASAIRSGCMSVRQGEEFELVLPLSQSIATIQPDSRQSFSCHHTTPISNVCFSHSNDFRLCGDESGHVALWEKTGKCVWKRACDGVVKTSAFSHCDSHAVVVCKDRQQRTCVSFYDVTAKNETPPLKHYASDLRIDRVLFLPTNSASFVTCGYESIRFWRVHRGKLQRSSFNQCSIAPPESLRGICFKDISFCSDNKCIVVGDEGCMLILDTGTRKVTEHHRIHDNAPLTCVAVDGERVVTGDQMGVLRQWLLGEYNQVVLQASFDSSLLCLCFCQHKVMTATAHGSIGALDLATQQYIPLLQCHQSIGQEHGKMKKQILAMTESCLVTSGGGDGTLRLVDPRKGSQLAEFDNKPARDEICTVAISRNLLDEVEAVDSTAVVACGYNSGTLRIVSATSETSIFEKKLGRNQILQLLFLGRRLYCLYSSAMISVHDVHNNYEVVLIKQMREGACQFDVSLEGSLALISSFKGVHNIDLFLDSDLLQVKSLTVPPHQTPIKVRFSQTGSQLFVLTMRNLVRFDIKAKLAFKSPTTLSSAASPTPASQVKTSGVTVFVMSASMDVVSADLTEAGLIWIERTVAPSSPSSRAVREDDLLVSITLRYFDGSLFRLAHPPMYAEKVTLSKETAVVMDKHGAVFFWHTTQHQLFATASPHFVEATTLLGTMSKESDDEHPFYAEGASGGADHTHVTEDDSSIYDRPPEPAPSLSSGLLRLHRVLGYEGNTLNNCRRNIVWDSAIGVMVYSVKHLLILQTILGPDKQVVATQGMQINSLALTPGHKILVGCEPGSIHSAFGVWGFTVDIPELTLLHTPRLHDACGVQSISTCSTQHSISVGKWDTVLMCCVLVVWDDSDSDFHPVASQHIDHQIWDICVLPSEGGKGDLRFASMGSKGLSLWHLLSGASIVKEVQKIPIQEGVTSLSLATQRLLVFGDSTGCLRVWNLLQGKVVDSYEVSFGGQPVSSIVATNKNIFASAGCGTVCCFHLDSDEGQLTPTAAHNFGCSITSLSQENITGAAALVGTSKGSVFVITNQKHEQALRLIQGKVKASHVKFVMSCRLVVSIDATDASLVCWDTELNRTVFHCINKETRINKAKCLCCELGGFMGSQLWCAMGHDSGLLRVFDLIDVGKERDFMLCSPPCALCAMDEATLVCGCLDGTMVVIDLTSSKLIEVGGIGGMALKKLGVFPNHQTGRVYAFATTSTTQDSSCSSHVLIWNAKQETLLLETDILLLGQAQDALIAPWDVSTVIVSSLRNQCSVIEMHHQQKQPKNKKKCFIDLKCQISCMVSSGTSYVAIGTTSGTMMLLDQTLQIIAQCNGGHSGSVLSLHSFETRLVSSSGEEILVWDTSSEKVFCEDSE